MEKVVLGLSGGVDSAVSASTLKEKGYEVHGVFLDIGLGNSADARAAAERLGIGFEVVLIADELDKSVCRPFAEGYLAGKTPTPCIMCNPRVKFPALLAVADRIGAKHVATGHYARTRYDEKTGRTLLLKNLSHNDQSYMLSGLTQEILSRVIFPLGTMEKPKIREIAQGLGLSVASKPDSMEICFIPDGDYAAYIERRYETPPGGNFVDSGGKVLGLHRGIHHYTVGQRRGLGVSTGERLYVSKIDKEKNEIVLTPVGSGVNKIPVKEINWIALESPSEPFRANVKVRHSKTEYPSLVTPSGTEAEVSFDSPVRHPAPGQSAVFYDGDVVLGGGEIDFY
jgi:tRNA-specific 2-thiouridylase